MNSPTDDIRDERGGHDQNYLKAERIVFAIFRNLRDRSGIGDELDAIDGDVYDEMKEDLIQTVLVLL